MTVPQPGSVDATAATVDLTGIDPVHWTTTRERVEVLRAWCAAGRHTRRQAEMAAGRLGLTVKHFYRLVSAWKKHRDARLVSGRTRSGIAQPGPRLIDARAKDILEGVVERLGPRAGHGTALAETRRLCAAERIDPPSAGTVHYALMRARRSSNTGAKCEGDGIVLSSVSCLLPVDTGTSTPVLPDLVLAVRRSDARIVAHRLVLQDDAVDAARDILGRLAAEAMHPIIVSANLAAARDVDTREVQCSDIKVDRKSTLLVPLVGDRIGDVSIRHRRSRTRATRRWEPLTKSDALAAVGRAVATHNAGRHG